MQWLRMRAVTGCGRWTRDMDEGLMDLSSCLEFWNTRTPIKKITAIGRPLVQAATLTQSDPNFEPIGCNVCIFVYFQELKFSMSGFISLQHDAQPQMYLLDVSVP